MDGVKALIGRPVAVVPHRNGWTQGPQGPLGPLQPKAPRAELPKRTLRSRFTLHKLQALRKYARTTSSWRHIAVIVLFPVPSIIASFLAPLVPLRDPTDGWAANRQGFLLLGFVTYMLTVSGTMPQIRAAAGIPHTVYSNLDILLVGLVATAPLMAYTILLATCWRFPVPFFLVLIAVPWLVCVTFANAIVLRRHLRLVGPLLLAYAPSMSAQVAQIVVYPAYSALFERVSGTAQIALILFFPFIKYAFKRAIFILTHRTNSELSHEISVTSVEVCSSMYQSTIMQTTPSPIATALLIGIDAVQGLVEIWRFMGHAKALARIDPSFSFARIIDDSHKIARADSDLRRFGTRRAVILPIDLRETVERIARKGSRRQPIERRDATSIARVEQEKMALTLALEALQAAETVLLVEYLEVAVPMISALYLAFATPFASSQYNMRLREFHRNPQELAAAVLNLAMYTLLQGFTLVIMAVALQYHLKLSARTLLAFVLEHHASSLQGKMVPWLSVLFAFPIVHFGIDFTFTFDFSTPA